MTEFETRMGVTYATHDGMALQGDLYLPKGGGPHAALIGVHGGGWQQGARSAFQYWGPYLASRGIALFAVSYRLAKKGHKAFPGAVQDVIAGVQFMRGNASEFHVDPGRIGLYGASAGGHLAALAALGANAGAFGGAYPHDAHAGISAKVKVLIGVYGVYNVDEMWLRYRIESPRDNNIENFLGASPMEDRKLYFDASPVSYAGYATNQTAVFLAVGTEDDLVDRRAHHDTFLRALKQSGFFVRTCYVTGAPHYWLSDPIDEPNSHSGYFAPRLMRFLAEKL